jgi:hypothetical protein
MGKNKIDNLLNIAIVKKELSKFIKGEGIYFVVDRETGEHFPLESYNLFVKPYLENYDGIINSHCWDELNLLIQSDVDKNLLIDNIVGYLIPYYSVNEESLLLKRTTNTPNYFINYIKNYILKNKLSLINDTRGTGVIWNSKNGLYGGILSNLLIIEERGGPKFI